METHEQKKKKKFKKIRSCQNELDMSRRLLKRLQHGIEGMCSQLVHFIDHVDLVTSHAR